MQSPLLEVEPSSTFGNCFSDKKLRDMFISGHATLGNDRATKLRGKLQENLPSGTSPLHAPILDPIGRFTRYKLSADSFFLLV